MSKHYSDRYVKSQSSRPIKSSNGGSNNGRLVEVLICVGLGSIVFYTMCAMALAYVKPMMAAIEEMKQEQAAQMDEYDYILNGSDELFQDVLPE
jgi:hypothetical protein